jgi:hypothetical protein
MANQIVFTDKGAQAPTSTRASGLKWLVIIVGIPVVGTYVAGGLLLGFGLLFAGVMGMGAPGVNIFSGLAFLGIFGLVFLIYLLPLIALIWLFFHKRYLLSTFVMAVIFVLLWVPLLGELRLGSPILMLIDRYVPVKFVAPSGAFVLPEKALPAGFASHNNGSWVENHYIIRYFGAPKDRFREEITYFYRKGEACKEYEGKKWISERVSCSPDGIEQQCLRQTQESEDKETQEKYYTYKYSIEKDGSCLDISFENTKHISQDQMLQLVNSLEKVK